MSSMRKLLAVHEGDMDCEVEPGIGWEELNERLKPTGLFMPIDPGPGASIGGMIATGCSGTNAVRYGTMKDVVLGVEAVLADGTVIRTAQRARKSSAGLDLTKLLVGSEGTLAVVTKATLRLRPRPAHTAVATCAFPSVRAAAATVQGLLARSVDVACVELLDDSMAGVVNEQSSLSPPLPVRPHLFFKLAGSSPERVQADLAAVSEVAAAHGGSSLRLAADGKGQAALWEARKVALWSARASRPGCDVIITDVCVPVSRLADMVAETKEDIANSALLAHCCPLVGHVGDGNLHVFVVHDPSNEAEVKEAHRLADGLARRAIRMGGTCTGEHGIGVGKRELLVEELGPGAVAAMQSIKQALDPKGILNPGKVYLDPQDA